MPFEVVTIDVEEEYEVVQSLVQYNNYTFTVLLDETGHVSRTYEVRSHPMKFLIDPSGKLVAWAHGYREWDSAAMRMLIDKVNEDYKVTSREP